MTRRALFLFLPVAAALPVIGQDHLSPASPPSSPTDLTAMANDLADSYDRWARMLNESNKTAPGGFNMPACRLWCRDVREKFRRLDRALRQYGYQMK